MVILSNNSRFEACSTVSSVTKRSLVGILDFSEDIGSETGSDSGGISSHDGSKSDTDSDYNPKPLTSAIFHLSFEKSRVVAILYSRDSNYKAYNYHKVAREIY